MFSLCQPQPPSSLSTQAQGKLLPWRWPPLRAHGAAPAPRDAARTQGLRLSRAGGSQIRKSFKLRGNQSFLPRVCRGSQGCRSRCCNFAMQTAQPLPWGSRWVWGKRLKEAFVSEATFKRVPLGISAISGIPPSSPNVPVGRGDSRMALAPQPRHGAPRHCCPQ